MISSPLHTGRPLRRAALALLAVVLGLVVLPLATATPAAADLPDNMTFDGRGWGHGRGMSQYGAQGYATNYGWTSDQILNHYYGGTTKGSVTGTNGNMTIRLMRMSGHPTRVAIKNGSLYLNYSGVSLPSGTKSVQLTPKGAGFDVWASPTYSCGNVHSFVGNTGTQLVDIGKDRGNSTTDPGDYIQVCPPSGIGYSVWYPESIRSQIISGVPQTMNLTTIEKQLRSVVPSESPSSWSPAALQSQAVAARSYALAGDTRWAGANTCDTIFCQVYNGWFSDQGGTLHATTHPNTDAAIAATANHVRRHSNGAVARTEFSSTSGGYTAGGTFPAVQDLGDSISPRHTWRCTVSIKPLESKYGGGSSLTGFQVTKRNGLGAMGGRVLSVELTFANGTKTTRTGNEIRSTLSSGSCTDKNGRTFASGLLSDWFTPSCATDAKYIDAAFRLFLRRAATSTDVSNWCPRVQAGDRAALTNALAVSDEWAGVQIADLYEKVFGREPDAEGRAYWLSKVAAGMRIEDVAAYFYGSEEYFKANWYTHRGFVTGLYWDLLGRAPDDGGLNYWVDLLDRGRVTRTGTAANFYASLESRGSRVDALYWKILGRAPDADGRRYWVDQLLRIGEVSLAANLAASYEYYLRAIR